MTDTSLEAGAPDAAEPDQPTVEAPLPTFADFDVRPEIVDALAAVGIIHPFPIQAMTLPVALGGHDIIGQAKTGTGKTLGFGVPLLQRVVTPSDDGFDAGRSPASRRRSSSSRPASSPSRWPATSSGAGTQPGRARHHGLRRPGVRAADRGAAARASRSSSAPRAG